MLPRPTPASGIIFNLRKAAVCESTAAFVCGALLDRKTNAAYDKSSWYKGGILMKKLYEKSELGFALVWIGLYVAVMNIALRFCDGFDHLETKTPAQLAVPVGCITVLAVAATVWIGSNRLQQRFGLCPFRGSAADYLWFVPLVLMSCTNLKNGLALQAPLGVSLLMMANLALGGYVEELIFRGFLFRAMEKDGLRSAVIVSAVTFGAGHIVNLANTADVAGVVLQVCYAIAIGFLYTAIAYRGGSLLPCILSHMFVNATSVFAREQGPFTRLLTAVFGSCDAALEQAVSALGLIMLSGGYALWLWKKKK